MLLKRMKINGGRLGELKKPTMTKLKDKIVENILKASVDMKQEIIELGRGFAEIESINYS